MLFVRAAVGVLAAAACAWFVLGAREAHEVGSATAILNVARTLPASEQAKVGSLLGSDGTLNPDRSVDILRGRLALAAGDRKRARRILIAVVRDEPQNLEAWVWLAQAANGDAPLLRTALGTAAQLDPRAAGR